MYAVSKGPIKIVTKARRGISQNLERLETFRDSRKSSPSDSTDVITLPKPVFHLNGKKSMHQRIHQDSITPQHEEIIRYIYDTWNQVAECDSEPTSPSDEDHVYTVSVAPSNLYYKDSEPSPVLRDFKPFDLESWWGKRLFHNITKSL
ncbi:MAPK regulated corepressor interacting protein 2 [Arctopsyche grandis]|uniref:MAPK regulated corepressor interacting protein 2 n=1 Tax=Arctopsyche grandis TaxID=121162 RepID=UPI00406D6BB5